MNDGFAARLYAVLRRYSETYGSGDPVSDLLLLAAGGVFVLLVLALFAYRSAGRRGSSSPSEVFESRLQALEAQYRELRGELPRLAERLRADVESVRTDVHALRKTASEADAAPTVAAPPLAGAGTRPVGQPRPRQPTGGGGSRPSGPAVEVLRRDVAPPPVSPGRDEGAVVPLAEKLKGSRRGLFEKIRGVFGAKPVLAQDSLDELEVLLVTSDLGVKTVGNLLDSLKEDVAKGVSVDQASLVSVLKERVLDVLGRTPPPPVDPARRDDGPLVVLVVGVNGAGKTTTAAKLAHTWTAAGARVMLAAADTFRAAAVDQLSEWGARIGVKVVTGPENARPATVVYEAMTEARKEGADVLIIDTAGRLHNKSNLMRELEGVRNVLSRHQPSAPHETLLVVDGTTGQNAVSQARKFHNAVPLTGLVVTKLDGTPKGGVVVAIKDETGVPVRYIGVGEAPEDLRPFVPKDFVDALFDDGPAERATSAHGAARRAKEEGILPPPL